MSERITYARATHGEEEIQAVVDVLRSGHQGLRIGKNVFEMEERIAALAGKVRRHVQLGILGFVLGSRAARTACRQ
ncbi:hypothetical protein ACETU7_25600 [Rhodococcus sp. 3Y1]